ncbi:C-X-C motif chemokine 11-6-like [Lampris incognitus]|uniref:C-X-C motif chemokine 11-6-like n=1 Tax=Lampris incognitus TaxID=2546036 RepID=UPI0024B516FB|nr:C-X-C motif chemokine 11-6-like [Lampris incognitus]
MASSITLAVFCLLTCLLVFHVEGQLHSRLKCKCSGKYVDSLHHKLMTSFQVHEKSPLCPRVEIVATLRTNICVNPDSKLGKFLIEVDRKRNEKKTNHRI